MYFYIEERFQVHKLEYVSYTLLPILNITEFL